MDDEPAVIRVGSRNSTGTRAVDAAAAGALALLAAALVAFAAPPSARAVELPELAAQAKSAVVLLTLTDASGRKLGVGTGFFISADGRLVTNYHVIKGAGGAKATLSNGKEVAVLGVLAADAARDIAILQAEGGAHPVLPLGDAKSVRAGDEVVVIGSPKGLAGSLSVGIVSAIREDGVGDEEEEREARERGRLWGIQITAPLSPGSSGSPIMTRNGDVIAVAVGALSDGQGLNFGIPVEVAKSLVAGIEPGAAPAPLAASEKNLARNLVVSGAFFGALVLGFFVFRVREIGRAHV